MPPLAQAMLPMEQPALDLAVHQTSLLDRSPLSERFPTVHLDGFLQFDSVWFEQSAASKQAFGDINDTTAVRRARVGISGDIAANLAYRFDLDFAASGHPSFRDVIAEFAELPLVDQLVVGYFKTPFQMDVLTSSRDFVFAERAPFFTFAPFRQIGLGVNNSVLDELATWSIAGFRSGTSGFAAAESDDGYGVAARSTALPWYDPTSHTLLHVGVNYALQQPAGSTIEYKSQLSFFTDEDPGGSTSGVPPLVDTGPIDSGLINLFNVELAGAHRAIHWRSELTYSLVDQINGPPLTFYGGYAQVGWILTGERRQYDRNTGIFKSIAPRNSVLDGGTGAWEVAVRGTWLNLNDANIAGGRLSSAEFVLNWYLTSSASLKFDVTRGFVDHPSEGEVELGIYGMRFQIDF